jgi:hypothetical protein
MGPALPELDWGAGKTLRRALPDLWRLGITDRKRPAVLSCSVVCIQMYRRRVHDKESFGLAGKTSPVSASSDYLAVTRSRTSLAELGGYMDCPILQRISAGLE